jgi:hypothetical protein
MTAVADNYSLHRNLRLDFINGRSKKAVAHLMSVISPATLKTLILSKLEMDKSELKKDFLEFVTYLEEMSITHDEHCHVVEHKKTGDSGMKNKGKSSDAGCRSSGHNSGGISLGGASNKESDRDRTKSGHGKSSDATGTGMQSAPRASALPQHKEVCGREALPVRLSSHWVGRSYGPIVRVQEEERCRQE